MRPFPALDFILRGEPEMTLRELLDTFEGKTPSDRAAAKMLDDTRVQIEDARASFAQIADCCSSGNCGQWQPIESSIFNLQS